MKVFAGYKHQPVRGGAVPARIRRRGVGHVLPRERRAMELRNKPHRCQQETHDRRAHPAFKVRARVMAQSSQFPVVAASRRRRPTSAAHARHHRTRRSPRRQVQRGTCYTNSQKKNENYTPSPRPYRYTISSLR